MKQPSSHSELLLGKLEQWKVHARLCPVIVGTSDWGVRAGDVYLQHWNHSQRLKRAMKFLGITWGLAVLAVLLPLLHFVLVPSLLLAGPALAYFVYQQESTVLGGVTQCPKCNAAFEIVKSSDCWPLKDVCSSCYTNVVIRKKEE